MTCRHSKTQFLGGVQIRKKKRRQEEGGKRLEHRRASVGKNICFGQTAGIGSSQGKWWTAERRRGANTRTGNCDDFFVHAKEGKDDTDTREPPYASHRKEGKNGTMGGGGARAQAFCKEREAGVKKGE